MVRHGLAGTHAGDAPYEKAQHSVPGISAKRAGYRTGCNRALTPVQRAVAIRNDTLGFSERQLLPPLTQPVLDFCRSRPIAPMHLLLLCFAAAALAAVLLAAGGSSPLSRFWAGIFVFTSLVLELAARKLAGPSALQSVEAQILHLCAGNAVGVLLLLTASCAAASAGNSALSWLTGLIATASAAIHVAAFDAAKSCYMRGAGAGTSERRESALELSMRRHDAMLRSRPREALIWRYYGQFRLVQQYLVPDCPRGSADFFWQLNRRRMAAWTLLGPTMLFSLLSAAAVLSAFWPDALLAMFVLIAGAGNILLVALLLLGWKTRPV